MPTIELKISGPLDDDGIEILQIAAELLSGKTLTNGTFEIGMAENYRIGPIVEFNGERGISTFSDELNLGIIRRMGPWEVVKEDDDANNISV
jgi:hypothetical protein